MTDEDESEPWEVLPPGTNIYAPDELNRVTLEFPDVEAAIYFFEFLRSWCSGEIKLEMVKE